MKHLSKNDPNIAYRTIDDETIIINLNQSTFYNLNAVATFIWDKINGKNTIQDIANMLCAEFAVDYATAEKDCADCINDLVIKNLVITKVVENLHG